MLSLGVDNDKDVTLFSESSGYTGGDVVKLAGLVGASGAALCETLLG